MQYFLRVWGHVSRNASFPGLLYHLKADTVKSHGLFSFICYLYGMKEIKSNVPLVRCFRIEAAAPSLEDNTADIDRLKKALTKAVHREGITGKHLQVPYDCIGRVGAVFRAACFQGFVLANIMPDSIEVIDFFPEIPAAVPAVALDLGTTHLEAALLNLLTGERMAHGHLENKQIEFGPDILTRIHYAVPQGKDVAGHADLQGLRKLQQRVIESVNELITDLAKKGGIAKETVRALSVAGNTTMVHLFLGLNPYHICREPYIPLINEPDPCHAAELDLQISPLAPVWVLPSIGSYFGGDLIAGILACGLDEAEEMCMLVDLGTNAEVVLGSKDWLIACAGAAGPALEGGVAKMGMRATPGAIERVKIDTTTWELMYTTIDDAPPLGICGSGLIDLAAQLYLARIIDFRGSLKNGIVPKSSIHKYFLDQRLRREAGEPSFVVAFAEESGRDLPVTVSQTDLDALMRSKAAMYAILTTLTGQVGVGFEELHKIYVAGAFGKHINPQHAVTLGMLPDLPLATYECIGNSSLRGAEMILQSELHRRRSTKIRRIVTYVELNVNQEFMIRFSGARYIPHTEPSLFPTVPVFHDEPGERS